MALSHANGNNVFNILIGLGIPWLLQTSLVDFGGHVTVLSQGTSFSISCLYGIILTPVVILTLSKWYVNRCLGTVFIAIYLVFIVVSVLFEMNILGLYI